MNNEKYYDLLQALADIACYNGYCKAIDDLIDYIEKNNGEFIIKCPNHILTEDCDNFINIIWQLLVLLYGDYGTSPRWAWIEYENKNKALEFLKYIQNCNKESE